ncbi:hypothetical protein HY478_03630 [Candidatus Uhrbacteria bacterium]|nr:hypothetical protein [Candidatus Uhrbacteria bacterium]
MRLQRVATFLVLCIVFGLLAWTSESKLSDSRSLLAAVPVPKGPKSSSNPNVPSPINAADPANKYCPDKLEAAYNPTKKVGDCIPIVGAGRSAAASLPFAAGCAAGTKPNAYGIECQYVYSKDQITLVVQGICVESKRCRGLEYINQDGVHCALGGSGFGEDCRETGNLGKKYYEYLKKDAENPLVLTKGGVVPSVGSLGALPVDLNNSAGAAAEVPQLTNKGRIETALEGAFRPTSDSGPGPSTKSLPRVDPAARIAGIAGGAGGNTNTSGNYGTYGGFGAGTRGAGSGLFSPNGLLSNFARLGGSGSSGGYESGGGLAYAPAQTGPGGFYNRNYDAASSQTTFPAAQQPYDLLAKLSGQTQAQRMRIELVINDPRRKNVLSPKLDSESSIVQNTIARTSANFASGFRDAVGGISDFFVSAFSPSRRNASAPSDAERFERGEGGSIFTVGPDEFILIPGDPTSLLYEAAERSAQSPRDPFRPMGERVPGVSPAPQTAHDAIVAIANAPESPSGSGVTSTPTSTPRARISFNGTLGDFGDQDSTAQPQTKKAGIAEAVQKAIGAAIEKIAAVIRAGISGILSWFF